MATVRFLDQVPVGVYNTTPSGGGGTIDIYQNGTLVSASVPIINFSGSFELSSFDTTGITVYVSSSGGGGNTFPFSGSAVITGSLLISGSDPFFVLGLPVQPGPYVVTYDPISGEFGYVDSSSGTSGVSGTSGTAGQSGTSGTSGTSGQNGTSGTSGIDGTSGTSGESGTSGIDGISGTATPASVQDSNYTSYQYSGIRYWGSKNTTDNFNSPLFVHLLILL